MTLPLFPTQAESPARYTPLPCFVCGRTVMPRRNGCGPECLEENR